MIIFTKEELESILQESNQDLKNMITHKDNMIKRIDSLNKEIRAIKKYIEHIKIKYKSHDT